MLTFEQNMDSTKVNPLYFIYTSSRYVKLKQTKDWYIKYTLEIVIEIAQFNSITELNHSVSHRTTYNFD